MARIILELTNRCNLRCRHCYGERHAATGDLPMAIVERVLKDARACGIEHLCFTGGEPTIHRAFGEIVRRVCDAGYTFSFVSNGSNFHKIVPLLVEQRAWFRGVTFSLDGAREATHDALRGRGSYRHLMRAVTLCTMKRLPFTFNMVLTAENREEVEEAVRLAERLGSHGIRFGHLMFAADAASRPLALAPDERRTVEAQIWALRNSAAVFVGMAPGYFHESPYFPCAPLELEEFNVDYRGNLTLCCQLSGHDGVNEGADVLGNLHEIDLAEACRRFRARVATYLADKRARVEHGTFGGLDHFPCWYCVNYLGKAAGAYGDRGWRPEPHAAESPRRIHVHVANRRASAPGCR